MDLTTYTAISPLDGRYFSKTASLVPYFSEFALMKYRVQVEIEYFLMLSQQNLKNLRPVEKSDFEKLRNIYQNFSQQDFEWIKAKEKETNHDVKSVEYFVKEQISEAGYADIKEFVHFGLTSQDINNTAIPLSLKDAVNEVYNPLFNEVLNLLKAKEKEYETIPMLAHTHGQPATPTRLGKEFRVFTERLSIQFEQLSQIPFCSKFGGATGNLNAHKVAYPDVDWRKIATNFIDSLGLKRSQTTTQIEHYDNLAALFDCMSRINTILIDFCRDIWTYISNEYFKQQIAKNEVGSSAMPHKVNPIDFENAEGNLGIANAVFHHFSQKLPISRLQRDLTDSTVLRNIGVPIAHTVISFQSILKGVNKLLVNEAEIKADLEKNILVISEAIQTILRREGYPQPYEALKKLTRKNEKVTQQTFYDFINELNVNELVKEELRQITPFNYTGI